MGGERHQPDFIDRNAGRIADAADRGQDDLAAKMLREAYQTYSPAQFNRLVQETRQMEQPGRGADVEIVKGTGDVIVVSNRGEFPAGKMHPTVCADAGHAAGEGALKGGAIGAIGGGLIRGDRKGMGLGALLGAGIGAIAGNESAKNDCHIVDGRVPVQRYERR